MSYSSKASVGELIPEVAKKKGGNGRTSIDTKRRVPVHQNTSKVAATRVETRRSLKLSTIMLPPLRSKSDRIPPSRAVPLVRHTSKQRWNKRKLFDHGKRRDYMG